MSIGTATMSAVRPVKSDQAITIAARKARGPKRSAAQPDGTWPSA